jgi:SET domain-containing protein
VDATKATNRLGRWANHQRDGNCKTELFKIGNDIRVILRATKVIKKESQIFYDYQEDRPEIIQKNPFLGKTTGGLAKKGFASCVDEFVL